MKIYHKIYHGSLVQENPVRMRIFNRQAYREMGRRVRIPEYVPFYFDLTFWENSPAPLVGGTKNYYGWCNF